LEVYFLRGVFRVPAMSMENEDHWNFL